MMKFLRLFSIISLLIPMAGFSAVEKGGFSLGATRVIYEANKKETTLSVINTAENSPFLAQSWISNISEDAASNGAEPATKPPFVMTPPLYRQDKGKNILRIIKTAGTLPNDRESAFWINVKAIPAQKKKSENANEIAFAYVLKIKMFYRPVSLEGKAVDAYKNLVFTQSDKKLTIKNPTPYYVSLNKISIDGKDVKDVSAMVPPFKQQTYQLPLGASGNQVEYRALNDQGGVTPVIIKTISK